MNENQQAELISVIIPVYNVEQYLDRCVQSVVAQTHENLEIILVDDGSPDNCPAICDSWAKQDKRIKVIHKTNGGVSDARNTGMRAAQGAYISFVDSDDWLAPEMFEKLINSLKSTGSDIAACSVEMIWDSGEKQYLSLPVNCVMSSLEAEEDLLIENIMKNTVTYKLFKYELIKDILFETGKIHEDVFWIYQAIGAVRKISVIDYIGYYYYQRTGSTMCSTFSSRRLDAIKAYCERYEYLKQNMPSLECKARLNIFSNCIYYGQMSLKYLTGEDRKKACQYLKHVQQEHMVKYSEYSTDKLTHRIWLSLARLSLLNTCRLRNLLHIGY